MIQSIQKLQSQLIEIQSLLRSNAIRDQNYYSILGEKTNQAYLSMNNTMCESLSICQHCTQHRDFFFLMLPVFDDLSTGDDVSPEHAKKLSIFEETVAEILTKISMTLTNIAD
jgi:spore cortex formation protein SpoVR/YcgB (stage V sporulation)